MSATSSKPGRPRWLRYRVIVYLIVGLAAVDAVVARHVDLWQAYERHPYRDAMAKGRRQAWDLVVVGGSPAGYGLDADVLSGLRWQGHSLDRACNLGLVLGTTADVYHITERALVTPPRLLLYGITASDLNEDRIEPNGPRQLMRLADVVHWCRERPDTADWCVRHYLDERAQRVWQLYYYRNGIRCWAVDQLRHLVGSDAESDQLGSGNVDLHVATDERLDVLRAAGKVKDFFPFLDRYQIKTYLTYLHRLLDWGEQHHVPVVLVDLPVPADLEERLCPAQYAAYRTVLAEVEHTRGVRVLRASPDTVGLTDAHFADLIHLNGNGRARLSAWVRQALGAPETSEGHEDIRAE